MQKSVIINRIERSFDMKQKRWLSIFLSILLIFSCQMVSATEVTSATTHETSAETDLNIGAESAILMDANTKTILYEKNAYEKQYPASITKLMTALLAIENLSPDELITFSTDAVYSIEPGSNHISMDVGEEITVDQALHGLLLMSANEVANGLAEAVSGSISAFADLMTERAQELGALNTHFVNPNGLHDENHYTTAYDMALIGSYLCYNDYFLQIMKDTTFQIPPTNKSSEINYIAQQHPMINPVKNPNLYREDVIGGKTGYTDQARQTLVTVARRGDTTLVAVVLKAERSTVYSDTNALLDYGFSTYKPTTLHTTDEIIKTLPLYNVKSGQAYQAAHVGISLVKDATILMSANMSKEEIVPVFNLPESLDITAQVGDVVGQVDFVLGGKSLYKSDLIISQINMLPEPTFSVTQQLAFNLRQKPIYIVILLLIILLILFIIFWFKRHTRKRKRLKMKRLFK